MKRFLSLALVMMLMFSSGAVAEWLYATDGKTNIRKEADINSDGVGVFRRGDKVWVYDHVFTEDGRNWCKIEYNGKTAYISDRYSSYNVKNPDEYVDINSKNKKNDSNNKNSWENYYDEDFEYESEFEFKIISQAKVRAWAGKEADILGKFSVGAQIYSSRICTTEDGKAWLVVYGNNQIGYVSTEDVKLTKALIEGHYPELSRYMEVTGDTVNVRTSPDIDSEKNEIVCKGDIILVDYYVCVKDGERRMWAHSYDEFGHYLGFISTLYLDAKNKI